MSPDMYVFLVYVVGPLVGALVGALLAPVLFYGAIFLFYELPVELWRSWNRWRATIPGTKQYRRRQQEIKARIAFEDYARREVQDLRDRLRRMQDHALALRMAIDLARPTP